MNAFTLVQSAPRPHEVEVVLVAIIHLKKLHSAWDGLPSSKTVGLKPHAQKLTLVHIVEDSISVSRNWPRACLQFSTVPLTFLRLFVNQIPSYFHV